MAKVANQRRKMRRSRLDVPVEQLFLDKDNPRLPEEIQGKKNPELLKALYRGFNLEEVAESMAQNGYFDEEPLVVIPQKLPPKLRKLNPDRKDFQAFIEKRDTQFTVVEGNRRLAAVKVLLDSNLREKLRVRHWPKVTADIRKQLEVLPVIVYSKREQVVPYLGVRHIVGIQKWDSYAKARYIAGLVDEGRSLSEVESQIGDSQGSARKNYISLKLLEQAENEFDYDTQKAKSNFSLLMLGIGQGKIKRFLGLPSRVKDTNIKAPVEQDKLDNLKNLMSWLFGDEKNLPVIKESRDITNYLSHVVESKESLKHLERTRDLVPAYDLSDGEEKMVLKYLTNANRKLEAVLGLVHRHRKSTDVITEVEKCKDTVEQLVKRVKNKQ